MVDIIRTAPGVYAVDGDDGRPAIMAPAEAPQTPVIYAPQRVPRLSATAVPDPSVAYRTARKVDRLAIQSTRPLQPLLATPVPSARVLQWKQDPTVTEIGVRKALLIGTFQPGPTDARIAVAGVPAVSPNVFGDFIETPSTVPFDTVHTFAVVRQTLTMYQRALGGPLPWKWNRDGDPAPLSVFPLAGVTKNAYYSREEQALRFFYFNPPNVPGPPYNIFTCRSFDIVAHETGHAILDGLQPDWILFGNPPQTGGLHESFGDLTAIFLTLSQMDQVEAIIAQTKSNLHDKTFLSDVAEEFGLALGRPNGLRNADNDFKLSEAGNEVHTISQVFTGGIYDVLADMFAFERDTVLRDDAQVLYETGQYLLSVVIRAFISAPAQGATYADVVNEMLGHVEDDESTDDYKAALRASIRDRFVFREVISAQQVAAVDGNEDGVVAFQPGQPDIPQAPQDRHSTCGTMQLNEYLGDDAINAEMRDLEASLNNGFLASLRNGGNGQGGQNGGQARPEPAGRARGGQREGRRREQSYNRD